VRGVQLADVRLLRAGKCAAGIAEQFASQKRIGNRGAVDGNERLAAPRTLTVNALGDLLLSGAGLARASTR